MKVNHGAVRFNLLEVHADIAMLVVTIARPPAPTSGKLFALAWIALECKA